jgi:hypothetical protein
MFLITKKLPVAEILAIRNSQYVQNLYIEGVVPAGQTIPFTIPLSKIGDFLMLSFTGFYTCLRMQTIVPPLALEDLGICPLRMRISAGASSLEMFGDFVPMQLLLSPGRQRVNPADPVLITGGYALANADQGPVPNQLFYPYSYQFPFRSGDNITVTVQNDFNAAAMGWQNRFGISFMGVRCADIGKAIAQGNKLLQKAPLKK